MKTMTTVLGRTILGSTILVSTLLLLSLNSHAQNDNTHYFCISDQGKPRHCAAGDIILIKPTMMPRVCDFSKQIKRMPKGEGKAEYLCSYTGTILAVKELKSRVVAPPPAPAVMAPPKHSNKMFDKMPFFK